MKQDSALSIALESIGCAVSGAAFGAALTAARVHLPEIIIDQFRLSDFRMFEVFSVALGSSMVVIHGLDRLGIAQRLVRPNTPLGLFSRYDGNILGGVLVGLGMSLSGSCPGTVTAQLAQGIPTATITALGGLVGGMAHIWFTRAQTVPNPTEASAKTISDVAGVHDTVLYTIAGGAWLSYLYYALVTQQPRSILSTAAVGGLYLGSAQLISILATHSTLGASGIYDQAGRYVWRLLGVDVAAPPTPPRSLLFGAGAVTGSFVLTQLASSIAKTSTVSLPWPAAFLGGFIMAYGAKVAKGCTSGHGLSGIGGLSFASLITVASMFGAGIASQQLYGLIRS